MIILLNTCDNLMKLRNGKLIGEDSVCIDFDEASREWRKNKVSTGWGMFRYK